MKKITTMLTTLILALAICLSALSGCALVQKNTERDINQVVATVQIDKDAVKDEITKREVIMAYLSYGYYYVQYYQYTVKDAIELVVNGLVENRIRVQYACETAYDALTDKTGIDNEKKYTAYTYLTEDQKTKAEYETMKAFNDVINGYLKEDDKEEKESYSETVRTAPKGKTLSKDKETTVEEMKEYLQKGIIDIATETDEDKIVAYNKTIEALKSNDLLGKDFDYKKDKIQDADYYKTNLKGAYESGLLETYGKTTRANALKNVTLGDLEGRYNDIYAAQKSGLTADTYKTKLEAVDGDTTKVYYNPYDGYGYVYNLLLSMDDHMSTELTALKKDLTDEKITKSEYNAKRNEIFKRLTINDLRSTWVTNNYDYDLNADKAFGEYSKYPFQGETERVKEDDPLTDENETAYIVKTLKNFDLKEFMAEFDNYVYGAGNVTDTAAPAELAEVTFANKTATMTDEKAFRERVNEMVFAYSGDPGSLSSYQGYVITPKPGIEGTETYVQEFADAARYVIGQGTGSYIVVATDFGYHIMVCSEKINVNTNYETLWAYVAKADGLNETEAKAKLERFKTTDVDDLTDAEKETYLYKFFAAYVDSYVTAKQTEDQKAFVKSIKDDSEKVKVFKSRYSDLG